MAKKQLSPTKQNVDAALKKRQERAALEQQQQPKKAQQTPAQTKAKLRKNRRVTERRVRDTKIVIGGTAMDKTTGERFTILKPASAQTNTKNPSYIVKSAETGRTTRLLASQLSPTAGRPVVAPSRTSPTGTLPESVARGQVPDSKSNIRKPMPERVLQKLIERGVVTRGGGGPNESGVFDPFEGPDLIKREQIITPGSIKPRIKLKVKPKTKFSSGGIVFRKNSFKGIF